MTVSMRVAAPAYSRALWLGAPQAVRVTMSFPFATYLQAADGSPVAVCTSDAARMPFSAVLPDRAATANLPAAEDGIIGQSRLQIGSAQFIPGRWLEESLPRYRIDRRGAELFTQLAHQLAPTLDLPAELLIELAEPGVPVPVDRLIGLGSGLTPTGDDVLYGVLCGLLATGVPTGALASRIAHGITRTTWLSAAILRTAVDRHVGADPALLLRAHRQNAAAWNAAITAVTARGHTSGAALAFGVSCAVIRAYEYQNPRERSLTYA